MNYYTFGNDNIAFVVLHDLPVLTWHLLCIIAFMSTPAILDRAARSSEATCLGYESI